MSDGSRITDLVLRNGHRRKPTGHGIILSGFRGRLGAECWRLENDSFVMSELGTVDMSQVVENGKSCNSSDVLNWLELADRVNAGDSLTESEALSILEAPDSQLLEILSAAYRVRQQHFGNEVQLYFLMNAKSGLCPEDCSYCSQSKDSSAEIPKYNILNRNDLLEGAKVAAERGAKTYCIVISARRPSERELQAVESIVPEIKSKYGLHLCASLGLLDESQAVRLKEAGVDRINHNLNTSADHYEKICSTHSYEDRIETLETVRKAGMELCSGGIVGMGESAADLVQMAFAARELNVESVPVNFLIPIEGAPIQIAQPLDPRYCLKTLAMFRMVNPTRELRIAGGREMHLGSLQPLGLYAANSIFVGDYLTTKGQVPEQDYKMIEEMGFVVTQQVEQVEQVEQASCSRSDSDSCETCE